MVAREHCDVAGADLPGGTLLPAAQPLKVLFVLKNLTGFLRFFVSPLEFLVARGHSVHLLLEDGRHGPVEQAWLDRMKLHPNFNCDIVDHFRSSPWQTPATEIRRALNYVRYLDPAFSDRPVYRWRSDRRSSDFIKRLTASSFMRTPLALSLLRRLLSFLDRAMPRPPAVGEYVDRLRPDLVALCDYGIAGSLASSYVEAARERGIPSAICVASWDNLSTRQLFRVEPDLMVVWNEQQVQEAVEIHGMSAERVVVTGAQCFDHWFTWTPRDRGEFCRRVGLRTDRPFVLWVGGALAHAERTEPEFVADWLEALRESEDESLRELGVLLRPHPNRFKQWLSVDFSRFDNVTVWPRERMSMPTDTEQKADYFDSIFHSAAVLGINSSAMIEAAIVGRPVLGIRPGEFHDSHAGTFHFSYVIETEGGFVRTADSIDEHLEHVAATLRSEDGDLVDRNTEFVRRFVRPHGLNRPATPIFVDVLERVAETRGGRRRPSPWVPPSRAALAGAILGMRAFKSLPRSVRRARASVRYRSMRAVKSLRRFVRRARASVRYRSGLVAARARSYVGRSGQSPGE